MFDLGLSVLQSYALKLGVITLPMLASGGASGADLVWAQAAAAHGCSVQVKSFSGHKVVSRHPIHTVIQRLSREELTEASPFLVRAATKLGKSLPPADSYTMRLLSRNWHIVREASAVYAVGRLASKNPAAGSTGVEGGTGWGCQLFADKFEDDSGPIPLYLLAQGGWFQCNVTNKTFQWIPCAAVPSPLAFPQVAGIGSREITPAQINAMHSIF